MNMIKPFALLLILLSSGYIMADGDMEFDKNPASPLNDARFKREPIKLPKPPFPEISTPGNDSLTKLKLLLEKGDINSMKTFYLDAESIIEAYYKKKKSSLTKEEFMEMLWCAYYITSAPLFHDYCLIYEPNWYLGHVLLDANVKERTMGLIIVNPSNVDPYSELLDMKKNDFLKLISTYYATCFKSIRSIDDPNLNEKKVALKKQYGNEPYLRYVFQAMDARNGDKLKSLITRKEKSLVRNMAYYLFPGKAHEVRKYINMAGYEGKEINELIDRTVGRDAETEFLYQGKHGREHDKKLKKRTEN